MSTCEKLLRDAVRIVIVHVVVVEEILIGFIHLLLLPLLIVVDHCVDNVFIQIGGHLLLEPIVEILFDEQLQEMKRAERRAVLQGQFAYDQCTVEVRLQEKLPSVRDVVFRMIVGHEIIIEQRVDECHPMVDCEHALKLKEILEALLDFEKEIQVAVDQPVDLFV